MTSSDKLRKLIQSKGLKYKFVAEQIGMSAASLKKKIDNESQFKSTEIQMLCTLLNIDTASERDSYFFAR